MALQYSTTLRNAILDQIESTVGTSAKLMIYTGAPPATVATATSGTLLVQFNLAADWAANASSGSKSFSSTPIPAVAGAAGSAGYFRLFQSDGTTAHMQGTITATGGGGDMTVDNIVIANLQTVNITQFTLAAPGA